VANPTATSPARKGVHLHCCNCGSEVAGIGYTECCNEPACDSMGACHWYYGTMSAQGLDHAVVGELTACCAPMADRKAACEGAAYVALSRKL
jgi:hypothetical protein